MPVRSLVDLDRRRVLGIAARIIAALDDPFALDDNRRIVFNDDAIPFRLVEVASSCQTGREAHKWECGEWRVRGSADPIDARFLFCCRGVVAGRLSPWLVTDCLSSI